MERVSVRKLAKRFGVATSFVEKLLKRLRETGDILYGRFSFVWL